REDRFGDMAGFLAAWNAAVQVSAGTTGELAAGSAQPLGSRDPLATVGVSERDAINPYKGLRPFGEADARPFRGRTAAATELADRVQHDAFVALVGPSGSGKSSLLHAGVVPRLRAASMRVVTIVPSEHPIGQIHNGLRAVAVHEPAASDVATIVRSVAEQAN